MKCKKILPLLLAGTLMITTTACSGKKNEDTATSQEEIASAVDLLSQVWETYADDERFPAAGGDYDNSVMDEPGIVDITNTEMMAMMLYVPQGDADKIDDAALLMHMMNANAFTSGAFHVIDPAERDSFAQTMEESIQNVQWMCGFPDKLLVVSVSDSYVVSAFGNEELMDLFQEKLLAKFASATVLYNEAIE